MVAWLGDPARLGYFQVVAPRSRRVSSGARQSIHRQELAFRAIMKKWSTPLLRRFFIKSSIFVDNLCTSFRLAAVREAARNGSFGVITDMLSQRRIATLC